MKREGERERVGAVGGEEEDEAEGLDKTEMRRRKIRTEN